MTFYYLHAAFSVWMIIDAIRRRVEYYWYLVILFVPFGPVVYFFMVKIHDYKGLAAKARPAGPSLSELRQRAEESPSVSNQLVFAEALYDQKGYAEAAEAFDRVLLRDPDEKAALLGLGRSQLGLGRAADAVKTLWRLAEIDNAYQDYAGILDLAEALWQDAQRVECIELLEELVKTSGRMNHRVALAHYLSGADRAAEARAVLEAALGEYERAPAFVRKRDERWAKRARDAVRQMN